VADDDEQVTVPVDERDDIDHTEFTSDSKKCPECGEPVDNIRKTCIKCGYEYGKDDYDDTEAGNELRAGTGLDDEGNEVLDDDAGTDGEDEGETEAEGEDEA
jgi:ribosomal protein S27AE